MSTSTGHALPYDPLQHFQPPHEQLPHRTWQLKFRPRSSAQQPHPSHQPARAPQHPASASASALSSDAASFSPASTYPVVESLHGHGSESVGQSRSGSGRGGRGRGRGRRHQTAETRNGPNQQPQPQSQDHSHINPSEDSKQQDDDTVQSSRQPPPLSDAGRVRRGRGGRRGGLPSSVANFNLTLSERAQLNANELSGAQDGLRSQTQPQTQQHPQGQQRHQQSRQQQAQPSNPSASTSARVNGQLLPLSYPAAPPSRPPPSHSLHSSSSATPSSTLSSHMTARLLSHQYDCCICNELIKPSQSVWSCGACYVLLHHRCVERWWNVKRVAQGSLGGEVSWPCAGCLSMQSGSVPDYRCFCGKIAEPDANPYITPHSCGQPCGKRRSGVTGPHACQHLCTQPCHPGPCSPCGVMLTRVCGCGRGTYQIRCGTSDSAAETCGSVCDKQLSCGHHRCERACHFGPCDSCTVTVQQTCFCEKETTARLCGSETATDELKRPRYSCRRTCNQLLDCGHHSCRQVCHPSAHPPCSRLPSSPQPCACGKSVTSAQRSDCRDPLPTCGARCGKPLRCGQHRCEQRCHDGECGECSAVVQRKCRCGNETIPMPCKVVLEAEQRKQRTVSEHLAEGLEPPAEDELEQLFVCDRPCNLRLSCGQHKCPVRCCPPSSAHLCMRVCDKPLSCGQHRCDDHCHGQSPCPPCSIVLRQPLSCHCGGTTLPANQPCGTTLKCSYPCTRIRACGHACTMTCHARECDSIAPCAVLTERMCGGGHKLMRNIPCYATSASCGVTCRKLLPCGQHVCLRACHAGPCKDGADLDVVASCAQKCGKVRINCVHACKAVCHPGLPCPDVLCEETAVVKCACGRKSRNGRCNTSDTHTDDSLAVSCDEQCEVELRNARLRDILSVEPSHILPYPTPIMQAVLDRQLLDFCVRVERQINDWMDNARQSTKMFPVMRSDQRWLLHQLAAHYALTAESVDQEPNRSVRFIRQTRSAIPSVALSSATRTYINGKTQKGSAGPTGVEEMHLLHFQGLTVQPALSMTDVRRMLHDWEHKYRLNWLDDDHAIAMFDEKSARDRAKERLLGRGLWRDDRDESGSGSGCGSGVEADGALEADSVCLYRKVAMTESGQLQGVSRDREKKRLVTGHDGFTAVVTTRRGAGVSQGTAHRAPAASNPPNISSTSSTTNFPSGRPLVTLRGLKLLQRQHEAGTGSAQPPLSPCVSPATDERHHSPSSRDAETHSTGDEHSAANTPAHSKPHSLAVTTAVPAVTSSSLAPVQQPLAHSSSVVGLYAPPVSQVRRDNRWAALMDDDGNDDEEADTRRREAAGQKRAGRKQRRAERAAAQTAVGTPVAEDGEAEASQGTEEAESNDWEHAAGQASRGGRRNGGGAARVEDHSAW